MNTVAVSSHLPCSLGSGPANAVDGAASNVRPLASLGPQSLILAEAS